MEKFKLMFKNLKGMFMNDKNQYQAGKFIKGEVSGIKGWEWVYLLGLLAIQVATFFFTKEVDNSTMGMLTAIANIFCVFLVAKGKMSNYLFGIFYAGFYFIISMQHFVLGEAALATFYFVMQFVGLYTWSLNMHEVTGDESEVVESKTLDAKGWFVTLASTAILYTIIVMLLIAFKSNSPMQDALTTSVSIIAQILMTKRFAEQWIMWIVVNVLQLWLWIKVGDAAMIAMTVAILINSTYGYINWLAMNREQKRTA
ncbi:nicotinamide mononucleotide transporter [Vagococcus coleopterorum]|uniref:Nicotinamide mononucleotide transporter n=1 Tax=Vagococcus coleopterorum TaxID=2714946 RepID=A0A6G8AML1_9ENTE|nr:nicotinamide riboside transporter PnuC [Vagococcus coleopterorum]QIL46237.1 nicotinamide mononucleotide transporter [Vagococcus coleopterorum]